MKRVVVASDSRKGATFWLHDGQTVAIGDEPFNDALQQKSSAAFGFFQPTLDIGSKTFARFPTLSATIKPQRKSIIVSLVVHE